MARKPASRKPKTKKRSGGGGGFGLSVALAVAALLIGGGLGLYYGNAVTGRQDAAVERPVAAAPSPTVSPGGISLPQAVVPEPVTPLPEDARLPVLPQPDAWTYAALG